MPVSFKWTPEEQRAYSLAKLLKYIETDIYPYHPHYRAMFKESGLVPEQIKSYRDFIKLPITEKADVLREPGAFCLQPKLNGDGNETVGIPKSRQMEYLWKSLRGKRLRDYYGPGRRFMERFQHTVSTEWEPIHYQSGGGAAGENLTVYYTYKDISEIVPRLLGMLYLFGFEPSMKVFNLFPAFQHIGFFHMLFTEFFLDDGISVFNTCGENAISLSRQVRIAGSTPFDLYVATPSYMNVWLKKAVAMVEDGEIKRPEPVKFALLAGENITDEFKVRIRDLFSEIGSPEVKLIQAYGSTELKGLFCECREESGFHLNPEYYFWEILDPDSREPVGWGEPGVLVFSHIGWRGTVLLRYWTGDYFQRGVMWKRCESCGHTMPLAMYPVT
ncbi:MAG: hypothetical protein JXA49_10225 [Actinobacteria bacterium]|nr:hypothetical protein [Actinomycetota bacterium]